MYKYIWKFSLILFFIFQIHLYSQYSSVSGIIIDSINNKAIAGANIGIEKTLLGAVSDLNGYFKINKIKDGEYNLVCSCIGFASQKIKINVNKKDSVFVEIYLSEQSLQTNEVIVTAGKRIQAVQDVPVSVSVIDNKVFEQKNINRFDEALQYTPGVNLNGDQVNIRGSSGVAVGIGSREAFLLDGLPVLSADGGDIKFDLLPVLDIERIEIVKGGGSALYGSGALGGVINIITKEPTEKSEFDIRAYSGIFSNPTISNWVVSNSARMQSGGDFNFSKKFNNLGLLFSGSLLKDDSYRSYDDSKRYSVFSKINYDFSDFTSLKILGSFAYEDRTDWLYWNNLDSATFPPSNTNYNIRFKSGKLTIGGEFKTILNDDMFLIVRGDILSTDYKNTWNTDTSAYRRSDATAANSEIQFNSRLQQNLMLTSGLCASYNSVNANIFGKKSQNDFSLYEQIEYSGINDLIFTGGIRYDYEKTEGSAKNDEFSPKFGITFKAPYDLNFRFSIGKGFRAPAIAERFTSLAYNGFLIVPNDSLTPEKSWSYEFGVNYPYNFSFGMLNLDLSIYQNEFYNMIEPSFVVGKSTPKIQFKNITRARIQGLEFAVNAYLLGFLRLESSITYMDPEDLTSHQILKYRPRLLAYNGFTITYKKFDFQLNYRHISRFESIDTLLSLELKDYDARVPINVVDARIIARMKEYLKWDLTLFLNCKNLFNYYYITTPGNIQPFRFTSLQAELKF